MVGRAGASGQTPKSGGHGFRVCPDGRYFESAGWSHDLAIVSDTDENRENPRIRPEFSEKVLWDVWLGGEMGVFVDDTETVTFVPDEPGQCIYVCTIHGHVERGMLGEFIVESG